MPLQTPSWEPSYREFLFQTAFATFQCKFTGWTFATATSSSPGLLIPSLPSTARAHPERQRHGGDLRHSISVLCHPRLGKGKGRLWDLEERSGYVSAAPGLEPELGSDVNSSPTPFPSEGSSPAGSEIKVVKLIRGSRQLPRAFCSLCIYLWRGKLDDQLPKALRFGVSSLEGQILPFFCWALSE